ncbi:MAG: glycerophosphodiester phosphodiesterase [Chloroflexi bacterium]|nr:glycerophosphodiester phosphodiesterase [Chloroflexota bacterium]
MISIDYLYPRIPAIIAHRGASAAAPENTLAAFNLAVDLKADAVELDVKLTKDRVPIIMHDPTVDRTTDGTGKVADLTLADLKKLDAGVKKDPKFAGERIPTLAEVFEAVAATRSVWINVELTNYTARGDGLEAAVVALIQKMNLGRRVLLSSFDPFAIRNVKRLDPSLPVAQLTSHKMPIYLRDAWLAPFICHEARHPDYVQLKQKGVAYYKRRGYRVNVWTTNDPADLRDFARQGVDGLITDAPDAARRAVEG